MSLIEIPEYFAVMLLDGIIFVFHSIVVQHLPFESTGL